MRKNGFTLVEILIAAAIGAVIFLGATNFILFYNLRSKQEMLASGAQLDKTIGDKYLFNLISMAQPSFGNIPVTAGTGQDDRGYGFFDYTPGSPAQLLPLSTAGTSGRDRVYTLDAADAAGKRTISFFIFDKSYGQPLYINPASFFEIRRMVETNTTDYQAPTTGTITYKGPGYNSYLSDLSLQSTGKSPGLYKVGTLLYAYTPMLMSGATITRPYSFFGKITSDTGNGSIDPLNFNGTLACAGWNRKTASCLGSFEAFLLNIPNSGGATPPIIVEAIKYIRLELKSITVDPASGAKIGNLVAQTWDDSAGGFGPDQLISERVKKLTFSRDLISDGSINYSLETQVMLNGP